MSGFVVGHGGYFLMGKGRVKWTYVQDDKASN